MNHASGGGEPHRALVDKVLDAVRANAGWLGDDRALPDLSEPWPALWQSAVRRQVALTDEPEEAAQESVRSMVAQLAHLQLDAAWFRDDAAARDRAIAETLLFGTQLSDAVPSRDAQLAWQRMREHPEWDRESWLAAWNAWHTGKNSGSTPKAASLRPPRRTEGWLGGVVAIVLLAACSAGVVWAVRGYLADPQRAAVGDCLADDGGNPGYKLVDCDDKAARYTVLTAAKATGNPCVDVPGASRLYRIDAKVFCVGVKGADPAKSANVAKDGDCLRINGDEAERLDCADLNANVKVLRRLTGVVYDVVPSMERGPCADVPGTALTFAYKWTDNSPPDPRYRLPGKRADLMFCLAHVNNPPPAEPNAKPPCQYVAGNAVLAALNAAGGNQFATVYTNGAGPLGCNYRLIRHGETGSGSNNVYVRLAADTAWPPSDMEQFDIDGAKAAWRINQAGGGYLYVLRPTGRLEIVLVLDKAFPDARAAAGAIYRAAAPHVP